MECIDPGSSDKHWDYPEGWLLLSEPPQWAPLTMTASPSAMAQTEGQFHENGGSVNIEELLSEARDQVQVVLMDDLRCLNKAELRKYNKIPDVERTKLMMRDSLPANVSDEAIANVCHYMGNSLNTAAQQHVRNSHYRPCRKKTERKVTDNEKANESQQGNVSADSADHTPASASLVDQVDPADHARNSASLVDSNSQQGDVSAESADHAVVSASPIDNSSRQGDASADAAEHALESARLVDVSRTQGKDTITESSGNTSLKMPVSMVGHRGHENALRSNVDGHDSAHNGVYDSACHSSQSSDGTPVRCCLCGRQFHRECIEFSKNDTPLVWTCVHCRNLASDVKSANTKIDTLTSLVRDLIQKCDTTNKDCELIRNDYQRLKEESKQLMERNIELTEKNVQLVCDLKHMKSTEKHCCNNESNKKNLVLGSSLLRNFDETKLDRTEVRCLRGAHVSDIAKEVDAMASEELSFSRITLLCGGNDASRPANEVNLESTMDCYRNVISVAKNLAEDVVIAEIPPRQNPPHAQGNIASLNAALTDLSQQAGVNYAPNSKLFYLSNGDINDGYLVDGTHLTLKGANKLARTMGLKSRQPDKNVCSLQPQQSSPSTRPQNKRNNDAKHNQEGANVVETDLSAEFWRTVRQKADHKRPSRQTNSTSKPMPKRPNHSGGVTRQQRYTDCCDYCGEPNHRMNNCRHGRHIECNECHRLGHKSKFCSYYWDAGQEEWPISTLRPNHDINYSDLDGNWSKRLTNRNVDNQNVDKPKRRQTKTLTNQNVDRPKRRQTKTSTDQNVDKPKRRQTEISTSHCRIFVFIICGTFFICIRTWYVMGGMHCIHQYP